MIRTVNPRGAFTLVEVMVAMTIFAMVIAGGIAGVRKGLELVDNSRHFTRISQILQSELESLRTLSWDDLEDLPATETITIDSEFDASAFEVYDVERRIVDESSGKKRIEVEASYTNRAGREVDLLYVSFFTKGGVNDYFYRTL